MATPIELVTYQPKWRGEFEREKASIVRALGMITRGGVVEQIDHIGSTAVPGISAKPCIDLLMSAWPIPLPTEATQALGRLGYEYRGENGIAGREYFCKGPHDYHLHVVTGDSDFRAEHLLFRDYLRARPEAARRYEETKLELAQKFARDREGYQEGKAPLIERLMNEARSWYREEQGFESLIRALRELHELSVPWMVSSGWALDLYLGRVSRLHHDVDIVIFREDQLTLKGFLEKRGWEFVTPHEGELEPWRPGRRLELPRHQAHAHKDGRMLDFLLAEREGPVWRFRREPTVVRTLDRLLLESPANGLPFLAPEVALLFKSIHAGSDARAKDQADFDSVMQLGLEPERRAWLRWALEVYRPGHPWLERLKVERL